MIYLIGAVVILGVGVVVLALILGGKNQEIKQARQNQESAKESRGNLDSIRRMNKKEKKNKADKLWGDQ